ncbi:hypothetical protein R1flu_010028 [Riccia fluitans]|uniref:DDE Tnp4 domain-containing protein n=1 Tax=Riccia fluitans TaxID=41844 RepID=A0ABD1Z3U2_9MARC
MPGTSASSSQHLRLCQSDTLSIGAGDQEASAFKMEAEVIQNNSVRTKRCAEGGRSRVDLRFIETAHQQEVFRDASDWWTAPLSGYLSVRQRMVKCTLTARVTILSMHKLLATIGNVSFISLLYLLGDSGYTSGERLVAAFRNAGGDKDKTNFNTCIAHVRIANEHCIGILKSRWHSLKEVRTQLKNRAENQYLVRWVRCCILLHNFLIRQKDDWTEADGPIEVEVESEVQILAPPTPPLDERAMIAVVADDAWRFKASVLLICVM